MTLKEFISKGYEFYLAVDVYQTLGDEKSLVSIYDDISGFSNEPTEVYESLLSKYGDCEIQNFTCTGDHGIYIVLNTELKGDEEND